MQNMTILTITRRSEWLTAMRPIFHSTGRTRLIVAESIKEAGDLLEIAQPQLIVIHDDGDGVSYRALDVLLWSNSVLPRPASVMVVVDGYSAEQATTMFQMGVDEYVCVTEHGDRMGSILKVLTTRSGAARRAAGGVRSTAAERIIYRPPVMASPA